MEIEFCWDEELLWNRYLQARYAEHIRSSQGCHKSPIENQCDGFLGLALWDATWKSNMGLMASDYQI